MKNVSGTTKEVFFTKRRFEKQDAFKYILSDVEISKESADKLTNQLPVKFLNDSVFSLEIPPNATVFVDHTYNLASLKYTSVKVDDYELIRERLYYFIENEGIKTKGFTLLGCYYLK